MQVYRYFRRQLEAHEWKCHFGPIGVSFHWVPSCCKPVSRGLISLSMTRHTELNMLQLMQPVILQKYFRSVL